MRLQSWQDLLHPLLTTFENFSILGALSQALWFATLIGDNYGASLGGSHTSPERLEPRRTSQNFSELPHKFLSDFPGTSSTVDRKRKRGYYERGHFTGGISRISKFSRISGKWSHSYFCFPHSGGSLKSLDSLNSWDSREPLENGRFWKDPFSKKSREWPQYCRKVYWIKMVQNGPNDHFGQNGLIPNWILAFARPKWILVRPKWRGPFWSI